MIHIASLWIAPFSPGANVFRYDSVFRGFFCFRGTKCIYMSKDRSIRYQVDAARSLYGYDYDLERLYEWVLDPEREPAQTRFTAGWLRQIALEIEIMLNKR